MEGLAVQDLIFKGTHNSYWCGPARSGRKHSPQEQIDDFGVWSLELDFSLEFHGGGPAPVIGHNGPGDRSCWAYFLSDYVQLILQARALQYRPVFIYLEVKRWKKSWHRAWQPAADAAFRFEEKWEAALDALRRACPERLVLLDQWIVEHGRWPFPLELAGKVVLYEPNRRLSDGTLVGLRGTHAAHRVTPELVKLAIEKGIPLERDGASCEGGARALRLDQYQADWTFAYGVPPNPIVVDPTAEALPFAAESIGKPGREGERAPGWHEVGEHGTYRFPYRSLDKALERARGITPATKGIPDPRRAGQGWTILVRGKGQSNLQELEVSL